MQLKFTKPLLVPTLLMASLALSTSSIATESVVIKADVWADNWFALYIDGVLVKEDSVPITTERSFNAESFELTTTLPAQVSLVVKDFKENDTGLEYIGTRRQQMGDGGVIAQFLEATTGKALLVTNDQWTCLPIHIAPLNTGCEKSSQPEAECEFESLPEPAQWMTSSFNDTQWPAAVEFSERMVNPKGGYEAVSWHSSAKLIWSHHLETDNTVLCRATLK